MTTSFVRIAAAVVLAGPLALGMAQAQTSGARSGGFLDELFGGSNRPSRDVGTREAGAREASPDRMAQISEADVVTRLDRLENYLRQLTGAIEQLQFRNQQLEQGLRKMQEDNEYRFQELGARAAPGTARPSPTAQQPMRPMPAPTVAPVPAPAPPPPTGRRSDVFDPAQHPNAPGAPRALGGGQMMIAGTEPAAPTVDPVDPPVGMAGGREPGAPLDLATLAQPVLSNVGPGPADTDAGRSGSGELPPPPPRNVSATGVMASLQPPAPAAPSASPKDDYDQAYSHLMRKDYALAEQAFENFLKQYPGDRRAAEATFWLGESLFQRQRYRDAAESYLTVTTKHEKSGKASEALFRLGQSLAALGEREAACAALAEVGRKYPRAPAAVKQGVDREQKRVRC